VVRQLLLEVLEALHDVGTQIEPLSSLHFAFMIAGLGAKLEPLSSLHIAFMIAGLGTKIEPLSSLSFAFMIAGLGTKIEPLSSLHLAVVILQLLVEVLEAHPLRVDGTCTNPLLSMRLRLR
jgi:hypothetical protein